MVSARRANTSRRSGAKTTGGRGLGASPWAWRAVQPHWVVRAGGSTRGAVYRLLCEWPGREPSCQPETSSARKSRGGERKRRSDQGREVSSQCVLVSKRRGWPSCKQTQDARREVDSRAAKGHSTPHPSCRGGDARSQVPWATWEGWEWNPKSQPTTPSIECPAAAAADADARWSWGRRLPLFFFLSSASVPTPWEDRAAVLCESVYVGTLTVEVSGVMMLVGSHTPQPSCGQGAAALLAVVVNGWTLESRSTSSPPQEFPPQHGQCSSSSRPPEGESVQRLAIGWAFLLHGWSRTSLAAARDGWRSSPFIPPSRLQTPSKQAHGLVACTSKKRGLAQPIEYLGQQCCCGHGQSTSRNIGSASIAMDPSSLHACLNWWRGLAAMAHCRRPCPGTHCKPTSPRVPADPPCLLEHNGGGIPVWCSRSGHLSHHQARAVTLCGTRDVIEVMSF
jgi:hypothetical protein